MRTLLPLLLLLATGCLGYRPGPSAGLAPGERSLRIATFPNRTTQPGLAPALASSLRRAIQADSTFRLATRGPADYRLTGTITGYERIGITFLPGDVVTARDFELRMTARVRLFDQRTGRTLLDHSLTARTLVRAFEDLARAERRALPLLCRDMALRITDLMLDGPWESTPDPPSGNRSAGA